MLQFTAQEWLGKKKTPWDGVNTYISIGRRNRRELLDGLGVVGGGNFSNCIGFINEEEITVNGGLRASDRNIIHGKFPGI